MTQSPFLYMKENSQTVLWNDSADPKELKDALTWGIVGATTSTLKINNRGSALAQWQKQRSASFARA
jgi:hypothetical protein